MQGVPGDRHHQPWLGGLDAEVHPAEMLQWGGGTDVEDVERGETHYGQGGIHPRLQPTRFIQRQNQVAKGTHRPLGGTRGANGVIGEAEPEVP